MNDLPDKWRFVRMKQKLLIDSLSNSIVILVLPFDRWWTSEEEEEVGFERGEQVSWSAVTEEKQDMEQEQDKAEKQKLAQEQDKAEGGWWSWSWTPTGGRRRGRRGSWRAQEVEKGAPSRSGGRE